MLKKSFVLLLAGLVLTSGLAVSDINRVSAETVTQPVVNSEDASTKPTSEGAVQKLTLAQAMDLALENNIDLKKAKIDYEQAITNAEQANYNADKVGDEVSSQGEAQTKYVSPKQAALNKATAEQSYQIKQDQTKDQVQKSYYDVLKARNGVKLKEAAVNRATEQLNLVQKKFRAGSAIKTDVNQAQISLDSTKVDLANAQMDLKNAQVAFNQVLGVDVDNNYQMTQELKYEKVTLPNVAELTQQALANRLDIKKAQNTVTIDQMNYDLVVSYSAPNTWSARKSKAQLDKDKLDLQQTEQNAKAQVISTIFQVQKADEVVQLAQQSLDQAKNNYSLTQRRYEIGVGTSLDVLNASIDLANSEEKYMEAVYSYTLATKQLTSVVQ